MHEKSRLGPPEYEYNAHEGPPKAALRSNDSRRLLLDPGEESTVGEAAEAKDRLVRTEARTLVGRHRHRDRGRPACRDGERAATDRIRHARAGRARDRWRGHRERARGQVHDGDTHRFRLARTGRHGTEADAHRVE